VTAFTVGLTINNYNNNSINSITTAYYGLHFRH